MSDSFAEIERVTGKKARGPKAAEGNELQVARIFFSLLCWWNCFCLRLTSFFLFSNLGLIMAQHTSFHVNCFMAGDDKKMCHPISKIHIVGEGPGETPSTLRRLSYLINSFLTDIKHLSKNYPGGTLFYPLLMSISEVSLALIYFNKTLLHKISK